MSGLDPQQTVLQIVSAVGPATGDLARLLIKQAVSEAYQRCLDVLCYARWFTPARVEHASRRLLSHGVHDVGAMRFLLENELDSLLIRHDADLDGQLFLKFDDDDVLSHRS